MKRPGLVAYIIGNPLICFTSCAFAAFVAIYWLGHPDELAWVAPMLAVWFAARAMKANAAVRGYKRWSADWNEVAGSPSSVSRKKPWMTRLFQAVIGIGVGCAILLALGLVSSSSPEYGLLALGVLASLALVILRVLHALTGWLFRRRRTTKHRDHTVMICIDVPGKSPAVSECIGALPEYCRRMLASQIMVKTCNRPHDG